MNAPEDQTPPPESTAVPSESVSSRRKLLQGALAAAPVMLTLVSRPVLGKKGVGCQMPSDTMSAGSIVAGQVQQPCAGVTASYWSSNPDSWPAPYVAAATSNLRVAALGAHVTPATLFHSPTTGFRGSLFGGKPLSETLQMPDGGMYGAGKYCAVALLNAASGRTPPITETMIRNMWNDLVSRGYYEPMAGAQWYAADIVRYIRTTLS